MAFGDVKCSAFALYLKKTVGKDTHNVFNLFSNGPLSPPPIYKFLKYSLVSLSICMCSVVSWSVNPVLVLRPSWSAERLCRSGW